MKEIKKSIRFYTDARKGKTKNVPIRISVAWKGKRIMTTTGHRIDVDKWNDEVQRVVPGCKNKAGTTARKINKRLEDLTEKIDDLFDLHRLNKTIPDKDDVRDVLSQTPKEEGQEADNTTVQDAYNKFTEKTGKANNWSLSTYKKHRTIRRHLSKYRPKLLLKDFDADAVAGFAAYLQGVGLRNTSVQKDLKFVYSFLKWASVNDLYNNPKTFEVRPKLKGTDGRNRTIVFLTWRELTNLYRWPLKKVRDKQVRDVFCFCCFTGLRYSDAYNLKKTDIRQDDISFITQKTGERLEVELNKYSRAILEKYDDIPFRGGKALPVISNQKMNDYLKDICRIVGIDDMVTQVYYIGSQRKTITQPKYSLIGTHAGRRTFITNALTMGIPAEVVMKWTGHKKYEVMKPYLEIVDDLKKKEMKKWNDFNMGKIVEDK